LILPLYPQVRVFLINHVTSPNQGLSSAASEDQDPGYEVAKKNVGAKYPRANFRSFQIRITAGLKERF
jgi:hypothetical protein